ncbi:adiponectin receptor, partial [Lecanoromycetidae sp. Uapishka_2]
MTCSTPSLTIETHDAQSMAYTTATASPDTPPSQRRRHSSYHPWRRHSYDTDPDAIFLKVDLFISELERRLDWIENYGNLKLDATINRAYFTLDAVRESCSHVSGELIGAGRRRARILVDTLESRYNDALPTRETLEAKAQAGMRLMEGFLSELETRALAVRDAGISDIIDGGWKMAEEGYGKAKEVVDEGLEKARRAKVTLKENINSAIAKAKEQRLIAYEDLPHPWRVNPHITKGYRFSESKIDCIKSAFNFSNESFNIWSHAIGLVIVLFIAFYFYPSSVNFSQSTKTDVFFAAAFFFAACKCLVCSCMWHTMSSISEQTLMERFACVDYTGISLLIAASIMTTEYTAFYCEPVPERWLHGWFDYAGGSHNIWHLAVLGGILFHYLAMQSFFSVAFERGQQECRFLVL